MWIEEKHFPAVYNSFLAVTWLNSLGNKKIFVEPYFVITNRSLKKPVPLFVLTSLLVCAVQNLQSILNELPDKLELWNSQCRS